MCFLNLARSSHNEGGAAAAPRPQRVLATAAPCPLPRWAGVVRETRASNPRPGATQRYPLPPVTSYGVHPLRRTQHPPSLIGHKPLLTRGLGDPSWVTLPSGRQPPAPRPSPSKWGGHCPRESSTTENHKQSHVTQDPRPTPATSKPRAPTRPERVRVTHTAPLHQEPRLVRQEPAPMCIHSGASRGLSEH